MRPAISVIGIALLGMTLTACPGDAPPPPFEPCGAKSAKISGSVGLFSFRDKAIEFDESSTNSVSVTIPSAATGTGIDDTSASGSQDPVEASGSRSFTATGMNTLYRVTVTGTINADCTGSGRWTATRKSSGTRGGSGTWKIE